MLYRQTSPFVQKTKSDKTKPDERQVRPLWISRDSKCKGNCRDFGHLNDALSSKVSSEVNEAFRLFWYANSPPTSFSSAVS